MGVPAEEMDGIVDEDELETGALLEEQEAEAEAEEAEGEELEASEAEEGAEESSEDEEHEVVLETGDAPRFTQAEVNDIVARRVARLNGKSEAKEDKASALEEENRLLRLALEQRKPSGPPSPNDFDDGEFDPAYTKAMEEHAALQREAEVDRKVEEKLRAAAEERARAEAAAALESRQREHYGRAARLKVKDYEATEDVAIEALGQQVVNQVIANFDDSHTLLYYLGKNPGRAAQIASLLRTNPIQGVAQIGRLQSQIIVKPKVTPAPDPEAELEGAVSRSPDPLLKGAKFF